MLHYDSESDKSDMFKIVANKYGWASVTRECEAVNF